MKYIIKKYAKGFYIILVLVFLLTGCQAIPQLDSGQIIVSPDNNMIPIQGTWKIYDYKRTPKNQENSESMQDFEKLLDRTAVFSDTWAMVADESCTDTKYQIRRVNTRDYMLFHYNVDMEELDIKNSIINIISITSDGALFFEIAMIDEGTALVYMEECFYWLKKISDQVDNVYLDKQEDSHRRSQMTGAKDKLLRSGVLIGLRSTVSSTNEEDIYSNRSSYRTIWISSHNRDLQSTLEVPDLFIPRRSGFWTLSVRTRKYNGFLQDYIELNPLESRATGFKEVGEQTIASEGNIRKDILFVGDDYIALEYSRTMESETDKSLKVLPLDNANGQNGILISDIASEGMKDIFYKSLQAHLVSNGIRTNKDLKDMVSEDNFTMERRNGHWSLKGRLNLGGTYEEFNIGLMPVGKLINYDELHVSWDTIKDKIPMALDAYTSPNKELLIVVTGNFIMVYAIEDGQISQNPMKKIGIKKGESVIMAEWATGDYVARWEKSFNQLNPFIVNQ